MINTTAEDKALERVLREIWPEFIGVMRKNTRFFVSDTMTGTARTLLASEGKAAKFHIEGRFSQCEIRVNADGRVEKLRLKKKIFFPAKAQPPSSACWQRPPASNGLGYYWIVTDQPTELEGVRVIGTYSHYRQMSFGLFPDFEKILRRNASDILKNGFHCADLAHLAPLLSPNIRKLDCLLGAKLLDDELRIFVLGSVQQIKKG